MSNPKISLINSHIHIDLVVSLFTRNLDIKGSTPLPHASSKPNGLSGSSQEACEDSLGHNRNNT